MSKTVAQASADYRKRKADKLARYETALKQIALCKSHHAGDVVDIALVALYPTTRDQLTASLREIAK